MKNLTKSDQTHDLVRFDQIWSDFDFSVFFEGFVLFEKKLKQG